VKFAVEYSRARLQWHDPDMAWVHIEHITRVIKQGERIYIHAGHNLEGRTPMILACLLIQRGYSTEQALVEVNAFWSKTLHFLIRTPLSEAQQNFISDWKTEQTSRA
jgi:hypothetical protein